MWDERKARRYLSRRLRQLAFKLNTWADILVPWDKRRIG